MRGLRNLEIVYVYNLENGIIWQTEIGFKEIQAKAMNGLLFFMCLVGH